MNISESDLAGIYRIKSNNPQKICDYFKSIEFIRPLIVRKRFLERIRPYVIVKEKQLKYTPVAEKLVKKGDVDVEICLDVVRTIDNLDVVIVVSGDSDLLELKNYIMKDKKKNVIFAGYEENMAWELRQCWHIYLNRIKKEVILE